MERGPARTGLGLLAIAVVLGACAVREDEGGSSPYFIVTQSIAERPPAMILPADNALTGAPSCPGDQIPWLVASFAPPPGGQAQPGADTPQVAFRDANPAVAEFVLYLWSGGEPLRESDPRIHVFIPVWAVAGSDTFVVHTAAYGPTTEANKDKWFAYPAKLVGCIVPQRPNFLTRPPRTTP